MKGKLKLLISAVALILMMFVGVSTTVYAEPQTIDVDPDSNYDSGFFEITAEGINYCFDFGSPITYYTAIYVDDVKIMGPSPSQDQEENLITTINQSTVGVVQQMFSLDTLKYVMKLSWDASTKTVATYLYTETYYEEHYGSPTTFNSVTVDFHNSIKAGATFNDIKNSVTVSTTPDDTVTYFQYDDIPPSGIMHGSEYIEDDEPLEVGKTYYINMYYKSSNYDFVAESDAGYPVNNITYNNMGNCSVSGSTEEYVLQYDEGAFTGPTKQSDYINLYFAFNIEPIKITSMAVDFNNKFVDGASVDDLKNQIDLKFYNGSDLLPIGKSDIQIIDFFVYDILSETDAVSIEKDRNYAMCYFLTVPDEYVFETVNGGYSTEWKQFPPDNRIRVQNVKRGTLEDNDFNMGTTGNWNGSVFDVGPIHQHCSINFSFDSVIAGDKSELPVNPPKKKPAAVEPVRYFSLGNVKKTTEKTNKKNEVIDRDTFKSEAPAHTVIASETATDAYGLFDLKVHKADAKSTANQEFLAKTLVGPNVQILLTQNIYPRRDLAIAENGALKKLTWNNLPKNQAGPVFAVVYNETDGAYVLNGTLDANGTAVFNGFKLRAASTITICK